MSSSCIDAAFFPHIVDNIWAHADMSSLLSLRVCKSWREKADRKIAYHLLILDDPSSILIHSCLPDEGIMVIPTERLDEAKNLKPSWVRFIRLIDLDASKSMKSVCELLTEWNVNGFETLRFINGPPDWDEHSTLCQWPRRVVLWEPPRLGLTRNSLDLGDRAIRNGFIGFAQEKLVVHQWQPHNRPIDMLPGAPAEGQERAIMLAALMTRGSTVVVVLHPWDEPAADAGIVQGDLLEAFAENLGDTLYLMKLALRFSAFEESCAREVVVVGLDRMSPSAFGLHETELNGKNLEEALREAIEQLVEPRPGPRLKFKTFDAYRDDVGYAHFHIEMRPFGIEGAESP